MVLSMRCLLWLSLEIHNPVRLPGGPAILGERLLPVARGGGDVGPEEPAKDVPAADIFVRVKRSALLFKPADHREGIASLISSCVIDAPLT